jgi:hypothetical protein
MKHNLNIVEVAYASGSGGKIARNSRRCWYQDADPMGIRTGK